MQVSALCSSQQIIKVPSLLLTTVHNVSDQAQVFGFSQVAYCLTSPSYAKIFPLIIHIILFLTDWIRCYKNLFYAAPSLKHVSRD